MEYPITGDVRVALCETNPTIRSAFQTALFQRGMRGIELCKDTDALLCYLDFQIVDLVICATDLPGREFTELIQMIREKAIGRNPFALVLATVGGSSIEEIRRVVNAGVDHVARKPLSMGDMLSYVNSFLSTRKPFVATRCYVGPSRRREARAGQNGEEVMAVPNSLRAKVRDRASMAELERQISQGMADIQQLRTHNSCMAISRTVKRVAEQYVETKDHSAPSAELTTLMELTDDIDRRHRDTETHHFSEIAASLSLLVDLLASLPPTSTRSVAMTLELMKSLGDVIRKVGDCDPDAVAIAHEIVKAVRAFAKSVQN